MKYFFYLIAIQFILILTYGGCSDDCVNCDPRLPSDCIFEGITESECLGETLSNLCQGMFCDTEPEVSVPIGTILYCNEIDCSSMECGDLLFTDLAASENNQITATVIDNGVELGNASCGFFQN